MASRGRPFKKGQRANPKGRPKTPSDIKEARGLTRFKFEKLVNKFLGMTKEEISLAIKDPNTPSLDLMVGSIVHQAVVRGDERRLEFILDRVIGKIPKQVELTGAGGGPIQYDDYSELTDEDVAARLAKVRARLARIKE